MSVQPTEELFDNLMKGLSNEKIGSYVNSDSESETFEPLETVTLEEEDHFEVELVIDSNQEKVQTNDTSDALNSASAVTENTELSMGKVHVDEGSVEEISKSNKSVKKIEQDLTSSSSENSQSGEECKEDQIPNGSDRLDKLSQDSCDSLGVPLDPPTSVGALSVEMVEVVDKETVGKISLEKCQNIENKELNQEQVIASDEFSQDSIDSLGVPLDPPTSDGTVSVEMIMVDVNQTMQDDDVIICSDDDNDNTSVNLNLSQDLCSDNLSQFSQETGKGLNCLNISNDSSVLNNVDVKRNNTAKIDEVSVLLSKNKGNVTIKPLPAAKGRVVSPGKRKSCDFYLKNPNQLSSSINDMSADSDQLDEEGMDMNCKFHVCKGCNTKFWILRFYYQHLSRITTKILYDCKECKRKMRFTNPCLLKIHFKSHGDPVDEIKINDSVLSVELPDMNEFKQKFLLEFQPASAEKFLGRPSDDEDINNSDEKCPECHEFVPSLENHLMFKRGENYFKCSSCSYIFTSNCSFKMHERTHNYERPYHCPECGCSFVFQSNFISHLFNECHHFRRCILAKCYYCGVVLPDKRGLKNHMQVKHQSTVFKCCICPSRSFRHMSAFNSHVKECHGSNSEKCNIMRLCELCPGSGQILITFSNFQQQDNDTHLLNHINSNHWVFYGFRCISCKFITQNRSQFHEHIEKTKACKENEDLVFQRTYPALRLKRKRKLYHPCNKASLKKLSSNLSTDQADNSKMNGDVTKQNIVSHESNHIQSKSSDSSLPLYGKMTCLLCNSSFYDLERAKGHILQYHRCKAYSKYIKVVAKLNKNKKTIPNSKTNENVNKTELNSNVMMTDIVATNKDADKEKIRNVLSCPSCEYVASSKEDFRRHVVEHREDGAYQCLECGECYVARGPLEIHLVSAHSIKDFTGYISSNFVHNSFPKPVEKSEETNPNQCSVCFDTFPDDKSLHLHFRSHGMAFLRQNFAKRMSS